MSLRKIKRLVKQALCKHRWINVRGKKDKYCTKCLKFKRGEG